MARYGMVIDLKSCVGCHACTVACKGENSTRPGIFWNKVFDYARGKYPAVSRDFLPRPCMHCENAPCVAVCPTGATYKRADGIVLIDPDKCIGCRYCMAACPYGARYFYDKEEGYFDVYGEGSPGLTPSEEIGYKKHQLGVVEKCIFCAPRVDEGVKKGLKPGVDWEATPACVNACPVGGRGFGDLNDPDSEVSRLIRGRHGYQLRPEMDTDPAVYYLQ